MPDPIAYVGTSGWSYDHWKGNFYPEGLAAADRLPWLADRFSSVEVNGSFYRIPEPQTLERWVARTPRRFRFAVKLWRGITHFRKLANCDEPVDRFVGAVGALPPRRRAPLLVQLPPQLGKDAPRLDGFLAVLKESLRPSRWKITVEFRHPDWLDGEIDALLDRHRVARCVHDMPDIDADGEPNDAAFVYVRRHGPEGEYRGEYADDDIARDADRVRAWLDEGRGVFVYYNNDTDGRAPRNAARLLERLDGG